MDIFHQPLISRFFDRFISFWERPRRALSIEKRTFLKGHVKKGVILYEEGSGKREKRRKGLSFCETHTPPDDV
jgi:hypothetical protein